MHLLQQGWEWIHHWDIAAELLSAGLSSIQNCRMTDLGSVSAWTSLGSVVAWTRLGSVSAWTRLGSVSVWTCLHQERSTALEMRHVSHLPRFKWTCHVSHLSRLEWKRHVRRLPRLEWTHHVIGGGLVHQLADLHTVQRLAKNLYL